MWSAAESTITFNSEQEV